MESRRPSDADLVSANVSLASALAQGWMTCEKTNGLQLVLRFTARFLHMYYTCVPYIDWVFGAAL